MKETNIEGLAMFATEPSSWDTPESKSFFQSISLKPKR